MTSLNQNKGVMLFLTMLETVLNATELLMSIEMLVIVIASTVQTIKYANSIMKTSGCTSIVVNKSNNEETTFKSNTTPSSFSASKIHQLLTT